jgi:hypothetical protein
VAFAEKKGGKKLCDKMNLNDKGLLKAALLWSLLEICWRDGKI